MTDRLGMPSDDKNSYDHLRQIIFCRKSLLAHLMILVVWVLCSICQLVKTASVA